MLLSLQLNTVGVYSTMYTCTNSMLCRAEINCCWCATFLLKKLCYTTAVWRPLLSKMDSFSLGEKKNKWEGENRIFCEWVTGRRAEWCRPSLHSWECVCMCVCLLGVEGWRDGGHHEDHWGLLDPSCCSEHRPTQTNNRTNYTLFVEPAA